MVISTMVDHGQWWPWPWLTMTSWALKHAKKRRHPRESIKVGCQCNFIVRQLLLRPNDVVIIIYTSCRYIDKSNVICHWKDAIGRPQTFNYAPHLTNDIWSSVQHLIQNGFNATMIWNKFISDVEHGYGELFTWRSRDALIECRGGEVERCGG